MAFRTLSILRFWIVPGCTLALLGGGPLLGEIAPVQKHLEITGTQRLELIYDYNGRWPRGGGCSAVFHLPIPPETGAQHIEQFHSTPGGRVETGGGHPPHRLLTGTLHSGRGDAREFHWRVQIVGVFQMRQLVDGPPPPGAKPVAGAPAPGTFLDSTDSINWDTGTFQDWLNTTGLRRENGEAAVDYGARLYAYLRDHGRYSYPPETSWNAAAGCRRLRTDCGGFSLIFAAACRANKIPARLLVGQWLTPREGAHGFELGKRQAHVIAEFFDPRIGWIPEDISSTFLRTPGFADTNFFGRDPGYFFAWHFDTDFHFAVPQNPNERVQWIQNPALWFSANAEDAAESTSHHWTVESAPPAISPASSAP